MIRERSIANTEPGQATAVLAIPAQVHKVAGAAAENQLAAPPLPADGLLVHDNAERELGA